MADTYYGVATGAGLDANAVTVGSSTGSTEVELRHTDGLATMSKTSLLNAVDAIRARIVENDEPN